MYLEGGGSGWTGIGWDVIPLLRSSENEKETFLSVETRRKGSSELLLCSTTLPPTKYRPNPLFMPPIQGIARNEIINLITTS